MPPVPGYRDSFYAFRCTDEYNELEKRWVGGGFAARASGRLAIANSPDIPVELYVNAGHDPQVVGQILAMKHEPPAVAFRAHTIEWWNESRYQ